MDQNSVLHLYARIDNLSPAQKISISQHLSSYDLNHTSEDATCTSFNLAELSIQQHHDLSKIVSEMSNLNKEKQEHDLQILQLRSKYQIKKTRCYYRYKADPIEERQSVSQIDMNPHHQPREYLVEPVYPARRPKQNKRVEKIIDTLKKMRVKSRRLTKSLTKHDLISMQMEDVDDCVAEDAHSEIASNDDNEDNNEDGIDDNTDSGSDVDESLCKQFFGDDDNDNDDDENMEDDHHVVNEQELENEDFEDVQDLRPITITKQRKKQKKHKSQSKCWTMMRQHMGIDGRPFFYDYIMERMT